MASRTIVSGCRLAASRALPCQQPLERPAIRSLWEIPWRFPSDPPASGLFIAIIEQVTARDTRAIYYRW